MQCPTCGYEEKGVSICSQCHASLPVKIDKPVASPPPSPTRPKPPILPLPAGEPPKEKHRRRPLMDLDLTIPELEVDEIQEKLKESSQKDIKP